MRLLLILIIVWLVFSSGCINAPSPTEEESSNESYDDDNFPQQKHVLSDLATTTIPSN